MLSAIDDNIHLARELFGNTNIAAFRAALSKVTNAPDGAKE